MHFIHRKSLISVARLVLAAMLFMQYSLATQACILTEPHPAMAFAAQAAPDCAMHNMAAPNQNGCFVHCTSADQTLDTHHAALDLPVILSAVALSAPRRPELTTSRIFPPL